MGKPNAGNSHKIKSCITILILSTIMLIFTINNIIKIISLNKEISKLENSYRQTSDVTKNVTKKSKPQDIFTTEKLLSDNGVKISERTINKAGDDTTAIYSGTISQNDINALFKNLKNCGIINFDLSKEETMDTIKLEMEFPIKIK